MKNLNLAYWLFTQSMSWILLAWISFFFVIPGVIILHVECCIEALAHQINHNGTDATIKVALHAYRKLELSLRNLNEILSPLLLVMFLILGVEQFIQAWFIFKFIRMGASWKDIRMLLLDLLVD